MIIMKKYISYKQMLDKCKKEFKEPTDIDDFVDYNKIQWSRHIKKTFEKGSLARI